ncbi:TetR/AcrR family transcriptional regulator [Streptomyces sp. H39-S7]|uniref:TetR/AcrR family transcriptional regulator n=1 Tax=Streptomyces sp. H39-S7 TaxID=3004357 RepID=UPI0022AE5CA3|nr:TetR/AcrR family transcriptional regulator [Streptomyces sp. H39-S7]MCZ4124888.1 TetR/AcrR family transcriptional regulator [Streptomyces sp. H39-S7]
MDDGTARAGERRAEGQRVDERAEGLRERKKRQTRQYISDVATGLFLERGFDEVTIAEIADAADVSVNTVYNYFPDKADLFFDRHDEVVQRLSGIVRGRRPGESAVGAVVRTLRDELVMVSPSLGLIPGYAGFMRICHSSPALMAKIWRMQNLAQDDLARTLERETGADQDDLMPELVAGQIAWLQNTVMRSIGRAMAGDGEPNEVSRVVLVKLDVMEALLSDEILNYATKDTE